MNEYSFVNKFSVFSPAIYNSQSVLVQADLHRYDHEALFLDCFLIDPLYYWCRYSDDHDDMILKKL